MRNLISALVGLLALAGLVLGLAWLLGPQGALPGQQVSPVRTPTPLGYEPTAPSEDWPTLTVPPTRVMPTPRGTPVIKPTPPPTPTPTPLPSLPLPPIPEGKPPEDMWSILYLPLEDELTVHGVLVDAQGRRWSDPQVVYDFRKVDPGPHTCLTRLDVAPTGDWLAVAVAYLESNQTWLLDLASQEPHLLSACKEYQACVVRDWSPDGRVIILQRSGHYRSPSDRPDDFVIVDVASDVTTDLRVPDTTFDRFSVRDVAFSPDGRSIAWTIRNQGRDEMTQIWLTGSKGEHSQLLTSEVGRVGNLTWHPDGSQIAYHLAMGEQSASIHLISVEGRENVPLSSSPVLGGSPAWSPDGLQIAMTQCDDISDEASLTNRRCNISVLDLRTATITPIMSARHRSWGASWSPNARLVAFVSYDDKELQAVWLFSLETGESYPVSGYLRPYSEYVWLPYGFAGGR